MLFIDIINCSQLRIGSDYFQNILNSEEDELIKSLEEFRQVVVRDQWVSFMELRSKLENSKLALTFDHFTDGWIFPRQLMHSTLRRSTRYVSTVKMKHLFLDSTKFCPRRKEHFFKKCPCFSHTSGWAAGSLFLFTSARVSSFISSKV